MLIPERNLEQLKKIKKPQITSPFIFNVKNLDPICFINVLIVMTWLHLPWTFNFDPSVTLVCFHISNSESYNWWKLHKHIFFGGLSKCVVYNPSQMQYSYIWILLSASFFPSSSYFKPLWHSPKSRYISFSQEMKIYTKLLLIAKPFYYQSICLYSHVFYLAPTVHGFFCLNCDLSPVKALAHQLNPTSFTTFIPAQSWLLCSADIHAQVSSTLKCWLPWASNQLLVYIGMSLLTTAKVFVREFYIRWHYVLNFLNYFIPRA